MVLVLDRSQRVLAAFAVLILSVGCGRVSFEQEDPDAAVARVDASVDASVVDAAVDAGLDGGHDGGVELDAGPPRCPNDPTLAGCWLLDGDGSDGSPAARPLSLASTSFTRGAVGDALARDVSSDVRVAALVDDGFPGLSVDVWARPDAIPASGRRVGMLDKEGQFGIFLYATAEVRCTAGGTEAWCGPLRAGEWRHVACTQDGTALVLYLDGRECARAGGGPVASGTSPVMIGEDSPAGGDEWIGALDEVRLWRRALGPSEVCAAAGGC